jgi:hypothetical protein
LIIESPPRNHEIGFAALNRLQGDTCACVAEAQADVTVALGPNKPNLCLTSAAARCEGFRIMDFMNIGVLASKGDKIKLPFGRRPSMNILREIDSQSCSQHDAPRSRPDLRFSKFASASARAAHRAKRVLRSLP